MSWGAIGAATVSLVGGALLNGGGGGGGNAGNPGAAQAADPFASQRAQYQPMLQQLIANPSSVTNTPGYQFNMQQGLESVQAKDAAAGLGTSGANDTAKMQFAEGLASSTYQQDFNNLAMLSGATTGNPGAASQAVTAGNNNINSALGAVGGAAGKGINNWLSGNGTTTDGTSGAVIDPSTYQTPSGGSGGGFTTTNPWSGGKVGFSGYGGGS